MAGYQTGRLLPTPSIRSQRMDLKLSTECATGLKRLGNSALINEEAFAKLLDSAIVTLTKPSSPPNISALLVSKGDIVKDAHTALLVTFIEAARCDASSDTLHHVLMTDLKWPAARCDQLVKTYTAHLSQLQAYLLNIGSHPPHIVDVNWRLDYCVKSSSSEHIASPLFLVQLSTEGNGDRTCTFTCTLNELQDLVSKLKDAVRQVERIASST